MCPLKEIKYRIKLTLGFYLQQIMYSKPILTL